jgi:hypothetical protein
MIAIMSSFFNDRSSTTFQTLSHEVRNHLKVQKVAGYFAERHFAEQQTCSNNRTLLNAYIFTYLFLFHSFYYYYLLRSSYVYYL